MDASLKLSPSKLFAQVISDDEEEQKQLSKQPVEQAKGMSPKDLLISVAEENHELPKVSEKVSEAKSILKEVTQIDYESDRTSPVDIMKQVSLLPADTETPIGPINTTPPEEGYGDAIKDAAVDIALWMGYGAIATSLATAAAPATGGASFLTVPLLTGSMYAAHRGVEEFITGKEIPTITGDITKAITGKEMTPAARGVAQAAEAAMFIGGTGEAVRLVGGLTKNTLKGVDYVTGKQLSKVSKAAEPAISWMGDKLEIVNPLRLPVPGAGRNIREMFTPGVVPMSKSEMAYEVQGAKKIRGSVVEKLRTGTILSGLKKEISALIPSERAQFLHDAGKLINMSSIERRDLVRQATRTLPTGEKVFLERQGGISKKVVEFAERLDSRILDAHLSEPYERAFRQSLTKTLSKTFVSPLGANYSPKAVETLFAAAEKNLSSNATQREIKKAFKDLISDKGVPDNIREYAKDMVSSIQTIPAAVAKASREAQVLYLNRTLKATKGLVSRTEVLGFEKITSGILGSSREKPLWVPRNLSLQLHDMEKIEQLANTTGSKLMSMWKTGKTVLRPAYHIRNTISNAILADWGGLPIYRMDVYADTLKDIRKNGKMWNDFLHLVGGKSSFTYHELDMRNEGLKYGASIFDTAFHWFQNIAHYPGKLQNFEENFFKYAKYRHNIIERGMSRNEAILDAQKYLLNYGEASLGAAKLRKTVMPFATWFTKIVPLMADTAVHHPLRFGKWLMFGEQLQNYALDKVGITNDEWERIEQLMPGWMQKGLFLLMPWRNDEGALQMLNMTYIMPGLGDLSEMHELLSFTGAGSGGLQIPNPLISIVASLATKTKSSGAPLYHDWEPPNVALAKIASYAWQQLMPAFAPYGTDWNVIQKALNKEPGALSVSQAMLSSLGLKLTPLELNDMARKRNAVRKIHESEFEAERRKSLRKATSQKDLQKRIDHFNKIREANLF